MDKKSIIKKIFSKKDGEPILREAWKDFRWVFRYTKKYRWFVVTQTVFGVLGSTLGLVSSLLSKYAVDVVTHKHTSSLYSLVISMFVSAIIGIVFSSLQSRVSTRISLRVFNDIRLELFEKLLDGEWKSVREHSSGDIINRLNNDAQRVASISISFIPNLLITLYSFLSSFIAIFMLNHMMALIALGGAPFIAVVGRALLKKSRMFKTLKFEKQGEVIGFEAETFNNYDTVKSLGASDAYASLFDERQENYKKVALDSNLFSIRSKIYLKLVAYLISFVSFAYCLFLLWSNAITYGTMTFFLAQRSKVTSGFSGLLEIFPQIVAGSVSAKRIKELYDIPVEKHELNRDHIDELASKPLSISLSDIEYSYEKNGRKIINNSSFTAHPGEVIGLIGPSGQGKTTMLRLILGLIYPQNGSAVIVDSDGNEHDITADHRRLFSYVPQGNTVVSGTIADNLRITNHDATDEEMINALKIACAWDFVERMGGLNATIGERGHGLSEGQAQRLAIARAVLRNAPVLMLDEATSSLDAETERSIINNTIAQNSNKTCIVSTHRYSVLSLADRIYRVSDGQLIEVSLEEAEKLNAFVRN